MTIHLRHLHKAFASGAAAVDDVSLEIPAGSFCCLVGPSGCGKTTVLRMLAGFLRPDRGEIYFGDRRMNDVPPERRNTAMVFQNYAIWPHLTVYENIAYGPRAHRLEPDLIVESVERALHLCRLDELAQRKPAELSGGQQQRVALARALAVEPQIVLFDEPLSSLDARLRLDLRDDLHRIQRETGTTALYVTHDQEEALALADRLAVMNRGRLEQVGTPQEIYRQPSNEFVARFMGEFNLLAPESGLHRDLALPRERRGGFRPEAALLGTTGIAAVVQRIRFLGSRTELEVAVADGQHLKLWTRGGAVVGEKIRFRVATEDLILF